jgi:hypothetical protein
MKKKKLLLLTKKKIKKKCCVRQLASKKKKKKKIKKKIARRPLTKIKELTVVALGADTWQYIHIQKKKESMQAPQCPSGPLLTGWGLVLQPSIREDIVLIG